jgi:hypothetical protein
LYRRSFKKPRFLMRGDKQDDETPKVRIPKESDPIPAVDPDVLRRTWKVRTSPEAKRNFSAVSRREGMIRMLANFLFDARQIANRAPS